MILLPFGLILILFFMFTESMLVEVLPLFIGSCMKHLPHFWSNTVVLVSDKFVNKTGFIHSFVSLFIKVLCSFFLLWSKVVIEKETESGNLVFAFSQSPKLQLETLHVSLITV